MKRGASEEAADVLLASISEGTLKQYEKPIESWWYYTQEHRLQIHECSTSSALDFFTEIFHSGISYSTLNIYRAAISLLTANQLGKDNIVSRYFKGVSSINPPKPKYEETWDPQVVLTYLQSLGENEKLSLEMITKKLATILALISAQRVQTLAAIELNNINTGVEPIQIKITSRIKTTGRNRFQPILEVPTFPDNKVLCAATILKKYIEKTREIRAVSKEEKLFLTYKKPHHAATTQSISRWIKDVLNESGIDTETFSTHSTRHAATSAAARRGVNLETIRKAAGWTPKSSVFAKFYNRPITKKSIFSEAILQ
ncbi:uncharacterized protein LOC122505285 [Leptopilina heterotoma]|uniref:uncharacterized protein LOC122505285 n=1 Tax=Leptopilina heterotoma TaxID=63436 RepID=UPI001CA81443|nr:uncharacterized protein LOC122505285 [Leptopilina heterotoma]